MESGEKRKRESRFYLSKRPSGVIGKKDIGHDRGRWIGKASEWRARRDRRYCDEGQLILATV